MKKWAMYMVMLLVGLFLKFGYGPGYFTGDIPHLIMHAENTQIEQAMRAELVKTMKETTRSTFSPELQKRFHLIAAREGLFSISNATTTAFGYQDTTLYATKRAEFFRVTKQ